MLRFVTTADTEILATAGAVERLPEGFPEVRCANPGRPAGDHAAFVEDVLAGARVVLCRVLGGRRGWPEGFDLLRARCAERGIALLALGGEAQPDAEMTALSLAPVGAVAQAGEYLRHGDIGNVEQLLRFLADTFLLEGYGFEAPRAVPDLGVYAPGLGDVSLGRSARAPRSCAADRRRLLLPLAPAHGKHGLRRRAVQGARGGRWQRPRRLELHAAPRRRRTRAGARAACRQRGRAGRDDAGDGWLERRRRGRRRGRRRRRRGLAGVGRLGALRPRRPRHPGGLRDGLACGVAGLRLRPRAARRGHPGRDPRVRRAPPRRGDLIQGARRRGLARRRGRAALRARPRALLEGRAAGRAHRPPAHPAGRRAARRRAAHELPDQARQGRHGRGTRHARERAAAARRVRGGRHAGRAAVRARRRAHARADRDRRPRRRVPDRRAARGLAAAPAHGRLPGLVRRRCPNRCGGRSRSAGGRRRATATSTATNS